MISRSAPSILTVTTLFPNPVRRSHGIFVETRLRKLLETGAIAARVLAPVPWLPPLMKHETLGPVREVPRSRVDRGLHVDHPRYLVIPKIGMSAAPVLLCQTLSHSIRKLLQSGHAIDLIDAHYFYPDGVAAVWAAKRFDIPVVVTARGTDINLIPRFAVPRHLITSAARNADAVIAVCDALKKEMIALGIDAGRITVLRNGVDLNKFRPGDRATARAYFGLERSALASVGHLVERKGHHHVIAALPQLGGTELLIAGDGPERLALERLAATLGVSNRVRFLGALSQEELLRVYNAVDALVLASSREGWANVLLESMACGTPVAASAVWGTPEVVSAPEAGVLMPSLDAAGVVAAVRELFGNPRDRAATRRYAERFNWDATTRGQLDLFASILARTKRTGTELVQSTLPSSPR